MVLCAKETLDDGSKFWNCLFWGSRCSEKPSHAFFSAERCEFVEPPEGAPIGEVVTFEGLPKPHPLSGAQVEKKKVFPACAKAMKSNDDCIATWDGHAFLTSAGPCKTKTIKNGPLS